MGDPFWDEVPDPPLHYDRLGVPISLREWADLREHPTYFRIGHDVINSRFRVSTVWLGINHNFWVGPPLIFETAVFDRNGELHTDVEMRRYSTEDQAREGHAELVDLVKKLEDLGDHNPKGVEGDHISER